MTEGEWSKFEEGVVSSMELKWTQQDLEVDYVWLGVGISVSDFKAIPKVILMC